MHDCHDESIIRQKKHSVSVRIFFPFQHESVERFNSTLLVFESGLNSLVKGLENLKKFWDLDALSVQSEFQFSKLSLGSLLAFVKTNSSGGDDDKMAAYALDDLQEKILKDMQESYQISFDQFTAVAKKKINYLGFLKC